VRSDLPIGTVTFLFTDVEGSTRLLHELGAEAYAHQLAEHRRIVRKACGAEGGVEVDTQGDAFFFVFKSALGAVTAAQAITEALSGGSILLRIGLHTGTPLVTEEGYVGDDVHLAARVAASGHGGQVLLSKPTCELLDGVAFTDLGEHRLKDIEGAVSISQLGEKSHPPLKTISNTNLPRPASSFVGRKRELRHVLSELRGGTRLLTLTGPGGSGKTRLALEVAAELVSAFKAGVFWIGLAPLREPSLVTETIGQTLGAREKLAEHIGEREMLLLIDNLEQVIDAAPELSALVSACPNLAVLCTSRELLRVQGEVEYPMPPLASSDAVQLFCQRSRLDATAEIAELCDRLDDLPLAVELAAARTTALSPRQMLERLSDRLDLLRGGRDAEARQLTLRSTIAWSYELLSGEEQRVFRGLSIFVGGSTLEAARSVADADLDTLQSLAEKSLLRFSNERYWMLQTIREFARQEIDSATERELRDRHADYYVALAEEAEPHLRADPKVWLDLIEAELDNFREALDYLESTDPFRQLKIVGGIGRVWVVRGPVGEGRRRIERALAVAPPDRVEFRLGALRRASELARLEGAYAEAKSLSQESLDLARTVSDWYSVGAALQALANMAVYEGDLDAASQLLGEALEPLRLTGDKRALAIALSTRGYIALSRTDYKAAAIYCQQSLRLASEIEDETESDECTILALLNLGYATVCMEQLDDAATAFVRSLRLATRLGWRDSMAYAQEGIAAVAASRGRTDQALHELASAVATREEIETQLDPVEQKVHEKTLALIRHSFSQETIEGAFEEARHVSAKEALARAIESADWAESQLLSSA
jgi:predicted ATPase/class 3 adenylate cyclase